MERATKERGERTVDGEKKEEGKDRPAAEKKKPRPAEPPNGRLVKANVTAEVTVLDLPVPSAASLKASMDKLKTLQRRDIEKVENERAKDDLESFVFETKEYLEQESVRAISTEEHRSEVATELTAAALWMEDDGYSAERTVYKEKLQGLKKTYFGIFKRLEEAVMRPQLVKKLREHLNLSSDLLSRMKNVSSDLQIFTDVEISSLEKLIYSTEEWLNTTKEAQSLTPAPVLLSADLEERIRSLEREVMYLLNKLKMHKPKPVVPPIPSPTTNNNNTNSNKTSNSSTSTGSNSSSLLLMPHK